MKLSDYVHVKEGLLILMDFQDPEMNTTTEVTTTGLLFSASRKKRLSGSVVPPWHRLHGVKDWNSVCPGSHVTAHPRALLLWRLRILITFGGGMCL